MKTRWTSRARVTPDGDGGDLMYPSGVTVAGELGKGVRGEEERDVLGGGTGGEEGLKTERP